MVMSTFRIRACGPRFAARRSAWVACAAVVRLLSTTIASADTRPDLRWFVGGHSQSQTDLSIAPGGRLLVTASADGTAKVWDAATGRLRHSIDSAGSNSFGYQAASSRRAGR